MYELDRLGYALRVLREDPSELLRIVRIGLVTAKFRYLKRCVGPGTVVSPGTRIVNASRVRIGSGCLLQDAVYIRAGAEGSVVVGDGAALNSFCRIFGHGGIEIGDDSQIGPGTLLTTTDHDYENALATRFESVRIGRRVWIGANVTVLPGIEIGDEAVIGAGSVVTRDIPPRSVAVGVPARVIRKLSEAVEGEEAAGIAATGGAEGPPSAAPRRRRALRRRPRGPAGSPEHRSPS